MSDAAVLARLADGAGAWPSDVAERYRRAGYWRGEPLDAILRGSARAFPERTALVCGERRLSYRELDGSVDRLAAGLHGLGLRALDRVVLQLPNGVEFVQALFAAFRLGAIPIMALPGHRRAELSYFCRHTRAVAYVTGPLASGFDHLGLARAVLAECSGTLRHVIVCGEAREFTPFADLPSNPVELPPVSARSVALLQLSGGSTGTPKLIARTHDDYLYSVRESARLCGLGPESVCLFALPVAHNFPLSSPGILGCLLRGGTAVLSPSAAPDSIFPLIEREAVTLACAVPALAQAWLSAARSRDVRFPSLKLLQVGGAKLSPDLALALVQGLGCGLQQVFGMAEGLVCYTAPGDPPERVLSTQGRPISEDDEVRIVDDDGRELPAGSVGHLQTRGPYTIRRYYEAPEHDQDAFTRDGFYRTGDLVRRTTDGYLVVEGRAKEQINRGGEKIAPQEIERYLLEHPGVQEAAVVGIPDAHLGERSFAFVVPATAAQPTRRALLAHLRARGLATFKIPDSLEFLGALPKTSVGKVDKRALARIAVGGEGGPDAS